jgi:enamine deaminase RidA (YjgF/YER057c/UK114 family)
MQYVNPAALADPRGYSNGVFLPAGAGAGVLMVSGQVGWNREAHLVSDRFADQFDQALANVLTVVSEAGGTAQSVAKLTIFVTDKAAYLEARPEIGDKYKERMGAHYPAMTLVEVKSLLEPGALVEIDAIAIV